MEKQNNTGLGLIKATIERVQNKESLFNSALKKLVNSSEEELGDFLKNKLKSQVKFGILSLVSDRQALTIKALDGKRLIYNAENTFKSRINPDFVNWNLNKAGIATPETPVRIYEVINNSTFMDIFGYIPGSWNQKWVSQNQVIDFCETLPDCLIQNQYATMFLIKKDENKPIDEANPQDNLVVVYVYVYLDGLYVSVIHLEDGHVWGGVCRYRVVVPQIIPLAE